MHLVPRAGHEKAAGDDAVRGDRPERVAGQLFFDELGVRLVGVKAADDVVAIPPGVIAKLVVLEAVAFAEAGHIEPVTAPALAVMRRRQQSINHFFVGVGGAVRHEGVNLFGRRRQAQQIIFRAAEISGPVGFGCWSQAALFQR